MRRYIEFLGKWLPEVNAADTVYDHGYSIAGTMAQVLRQCGDDLTRQNVMRQAANSRGIACRCSCPA